MKKVNIQYDSTIPENDRDILESRADVFARAIEFCSAFWTFVEDSKCRKYYQLKRPDANKPCYVQLTIDEVRLLSDSEIERIIIAGERACFQPSEHQRITREYVANRIEEWITRLTRLFDQIESWVRASPEWITDRSLMQQRDEELMRSQGIPPGQVPFLTLWADAKKHRVSFVPSAIWIIGADGRVNITTNTRQYILVDRRGGQDANSDWQLVTDDLRKATVQFDRNALLSILQGAR